MNHIKALAIAQSIQQDRLETARRHRHPRPVKPNRPEGRSHFGNMVRVFLTGLRHKPQPSR